MALDIDVHLNQLRSHAARLGVFEHVIGHPPLNSPPTGIWVAFEFAGFKPSKSSGLAATSGLVTFTADIGRNVATEPQDDIEIEITKATSLLIAAYSGDFDLGGNVRCVDLLGQESGGLTADPSYAKHDDGPVFRLVTVTIPLIVNDVFSQVS